MTTLRTPSPPGSSSRSARRIRKRFACSQRDGCVLRAAACEPFPAQGCRTDWKSVLQWPGPTDREERLMFEMLKKLRYGARVLLSRKGGEPETIDVRGRSTVIMHGGNGPPF